MIFAFVLFACIDGFCDVGGPLPAAIETHILTGGLGAGDPNETGSIPAAVPPIVFADLIHPVAPKEDSETCETGTCDVRGRGLPDTSERDKASRPAHVRRFQPLRNLFRGRR
jgi:hypothetical protein